MSNPAVELSTPFDRIDDAIQLGELIVRLETAVAVNPEAVMSIGLGEAHSFRGDYSCVAFAYVGTGTVSEALESAKAAVGASFRGYKGGSFTMSEATYCYVAMGEGIARGPFGNDSDDDAALSRERLLDSLRG